MRSERIVRQRVLPSTLWEAVGAWGPAVRPRSGLTRRCSKPRRQKGPHDATTSRQRGRVVRVTRASRSAAHILSRDDARAHGRSECADRVSRLRHDRSSALLFLGIPPSSAAPLFVTRVAPLFSRSSALAPRAAARRRRLCECRRSERTSRIQPCYCTPPGRLHLPPSLLDSLTCVSRAPFCPSAQSSSAAPLCVSCSSSRLRDPSVPRFSKLDRRFARPFACRQEFLRCSSCLHGSSGARSQVRARLLRAGFVWLACVFAARRRRLRIHWMVLPAWLRDASERRSP